MTNDKALQMTGINSSKRHLSLGLLLLAGVVFSGCALSQERIKLAYSPDSAASRLVGADKVNVFVNGSDRREIRHKVSSKKNGWGMEMAPISAENEPLGLIVEAVGTELKNRGFVVGPAPAEVAITLTKFYSNFEIGFWSGNAIADVIFTAEVKRLNEPALYNKEIHETYNLSGVMLMTGGNAKAALDAALKASVSKLLGDKDFLLALFPKK